MLRYLFQFAIVMHTCSTRSAISTQPYIDVKQSNDLEISPRSSTVVSPESSRVISYQQCQFLDVSYIISEIMDVGMTTQAEMTFIFIQSRRRGTNKKLVYEQPILSVGIISELELSTPLYQGQCMSCYQWSIVTFAVSLTDSKIRAVLMLKTTYLPTPLVLDLKLEDHAV